MRKIRGQLREICAASRLNETKKYIQHGDTSCFKHTVAVAAMSCRIADRLHISVNRGELIRGALLHDYFLYDWHKPRKGRSVHGFTHPGAALKNAERDFELTDRERDIIKKHMFPLTPIPPKYREGFLVCIADKYCSVLETFKKHPYRRGRL
ncbi:MAG: HD domain-containing protein [Clostridiales bacterium]|nr:HD domain-containing protein [Clostridiales bacterium]